MGSWLTNGSMRVYGVIGGVGALGFGPNSFEYPGTTDTNLVTRVQYNVNSGDPMWNDDRINGSVQFDFAGWLGGYPSGSLPPGSWGTSAAMVFAPASEFPEGMIPKPSDIIANSRNRIVKRGEPTGLGDYKISFFFTGPRPSDLIPNMKYWVLIMPTWSRISHTPSLDNDRIILPGQVNNLGRALSMHTNRKPTRPQILTPKSGAVIPSSTDFLISFLVNDADKWGSGTSPAYTGIQGVQAQISRPPSAANPDPVWHELTFCTSATEEQPIAHIVGSATPALTAGAAIFAQTGTATARAGSSGASASAINKVPVGEGDWRIRVRVFDSGNPFTDLPPLNGGATGANSTYYNYPAANTSEWSEIVTIKIPAQVPPPIPIKPAPNTAVPKEDIIRLQWQYRNTAMPSGPGSFYIQMGRLVQIREVGDTEWTTLTNSLLGPYDIDSQLDYIDVLTGDYADPVPDTDFLTPNDGRWSFADFYTQATYPDDGVLTMSGTTPATSYMTVVSVPPTAAVGDYYLRRRFDLPVDTDSINAKFTIELPDGAVDPLRNFGLVYGVYFYAADGITVLDSVSVVSSTSNPYPMVFDQSGISVPPGTAYGEIVLHPTGFITSDGLEGVRVSGIRVSTGNTFGGLPWFEMDYTKQYEWRVVARDADGKISDWSDVAQFWVVPPPGDGTPELDPNATLDGATLGCGTYTVSVVRRGGMDMPFVIPNPQYIRWGRIRDDISSATVALDRWSEDCGQFLKNLRTWGYELTIHRSTIYGTQLVWQGPITRLKYEKDRVTIAAEDVMAYLKRRAVRTTLNDVKDGASVVDRAQRVIQNSLAIEDPNLLPYLTVIHGDKDATQHRYLAEYANTAFGELDDMASNAGLDYTAIGRRIIVWGVKNRVGELNEMTDKDFGDAPSVTEYGSQMAVRYIITDGNGLWGGSKITDGQSLLDFGLVEILATSWGAEVNTTGETQTQSEEAKERIRKGYEEQAQAEMDDRFPAPVVLRVPENNTLSPDALVNINQLVPGVLIPVRSSGTLRDIVGMQKLDSIQVEVQDGRERVSVSMSPFGTSAAIEEGGEL